MYEFSLLLGFGWLALGAISLLTLAYRPGPLPLALAIASLASIIIDFTGGSIAAMAFGPIIVLVASHAILRHILLPWHVVAPASAALLPATPAPAEQSPAVAKRHVLLLRQRSHRSPLWLAHDGYGVILVLPTIPARAKSGCRVPLLKKGDGTLWAET